MYKHQTSNNHIHHVIFTASNHRGSTRLSVSNQPLHGFVTFLIDLRRRTQQKTSLPKYITYIRVIEMAHLIISSLSFHKKPVCLSVCLSVNHIYLTFIYHTLPVVSVYLSLVLKHIQNLKFPVASSPLATNTCDLVSECGQFGRSKIQCALHMVVLLFVHVSLADCVKPQNLPFSLELPDQRARKMREL